MLAYHKPVAVDADWVNSYFPMRILFALTTALFFMISTHARAEITRVEFVMGSGKERMILFSHEALAHKRMFFLDTPDRLVIDFPATNARPLALPEDYSGRFIRQMRFGKFNPSLTRIVLDLNQQVTVLGSYAVPPSGEIREWQYVVDLAAAQGGSASAIVTPKTAAPPPIASKPKPKPLIVIDAGHGGQDPGAIGASKTLEKNVTLAYAKALRKALLKTGRYRVALTREDDRFIMLGERVDIARKLSADLFISLHADSNPRRDARGFSVYSLSETASDAESAALAEQENSVDFLGGMEEIKVEDPEVADILIDLTQRETMTKSSEFAEVIVASMHPKVRQLAKTHRYAGFRVLKAPDIPSVLIEIGFLSNPEDERLLASPEFRDLVISSLVGAIDKYLGIEE